MNEVRRLRDDDISVRRINSDYLLLINRFCDRDNDISTCRNKLQTEVFSHEWFVALFEEKLEFAKLDLFNKPFFKEALRQFYAQAHDFLLRFKFVGYYYVKDIEAWVEYISTPHLLDEEEDKEQEDENGDIVDKIGVTLLSPDGDDIVVEEEEVVMDLDTMLRNNILRNFPFGVLGVGTENVFIPGEYVVVEERRTMRRTIEFQCEDEDLYERMSFNVINHGAHLQPISYAWDNNIHLLGQRDDMVPVSPFADLYRQKLLIREAETGEFDANSLAIYPEPLIIDNPQKDAVMDDIQDATLYSVDNITCAKQSENVYREEMGMQNTRNQRDQLAMKRTVAYNKGRCGGVGGQVEMKTSHVIWDHKDEYHRPTHYEALKAVARSVTVVPGKAGSPVVKSEALVRKYEEAVCNVMNVPFSFFKPHSALQQLNSNSKKQASASMGRTSHNDAFQKELEKEVRGQHLLFDELFREVYDFTFAKLDKQLLRRQARSLVPGIRFDHILVKSEEALRDLAAYEKAGYVSIEEVSRLIHKHHNIPLPASLEVDNSSVKRRRIDPLPIVAVKTKVEEEYDSEDSY